MGWKVDADIDELKTGVSKLESIVNDISTNNETMNTVLGNMSTVWEGSAATAFITYLQNECSEAEESKAILVDFIAALKEHCGQLEEKDNFFEKAIYEIGSWLGLH